MLSRVRHAGVKTIGALAAVAIGTGVLSATAALPVVGVAGIAVRDAARTFSRLPVADLGQVPAKSVLLDSSGSVLATYYPRDIFRDPVRWGQIAPVMRNAIVAIEDYRFWSHGAFDLHGTLRAIVSTLSHTQVQGGSDLAQQYVKNACVLTAKTQADALRCTAFHVSRKILELRAAANVARRMTKAQLLTAYLNVAYFDHQAYGIKVASEEYFSTEPADLTLTQAALLAGLVESPTAYDPVSNPKAARQRRDEVLAAMAQHGYISWAAASRAARKPLGLHLSAVPLQTGCISPSASQWAFFCDYVLAAMARDPAYRKAYNELQTVGGLKIYTTMNLKDQIAAEKAVNYVVPAHSPTDNPGQNVDTEVLIQPGSGYVRAIAVDRPYGFGPGQDSIDYAVDAAYNGGAGVQTGSSSKLFTLITALEEGYGFGFSLKVKSGMFVGGMTNCAGAVINPFQVYNADPGGENGNIPLYYGTTASINAFYVSLEAKVGLCHVVHTAVALGVHRSDGRSLLSWVGHPGWPKSLPPADDLASFTLGSVNVSPMTMAAAYATVASRGIYCHPIAITAITDSAGRNLPVESANCNRVISQGIADAVNYVLQGVLTSGTATGRSIGRPAAAKTGTANGGYYAAFAGYTPTLVAYVSVFNPLNPTGLGAMLGIRATFRDYPAGYAWSAGQMYGANAPGATWQYTFTHADLGPVVAFVYPPLSFGPGQGLTPVSPPKKKGNGGNGGPGGGGTGGGGGHH